MFCLLFWLYPFSLFRLPVACLSIFEKVNYFRARELSKSSSRRRLSTMSSMCNAPVIECFVEQCVYKKTRDACCMRSSIFAALIPNQSRVKSSEAFLHQLSLSVNNLR